MAHPTEQPAILHSWMAQGTERGTNEKITRWGTSREDVLKKMPSTIPEKDVRLYQRREEDE